LNFQQDINEQEKFWRTLGMEKPHHDELRVSLFCYDRAPVAEMLSIWAEGETAVTCLVPEGVAARQIQQFFGRSEANPGTVLEKGRLTVRIYPFLEQDQYDRLLWGCQLNFVRGEDSFVRAQWAAQPLVWQIYPQEEQAHWPKLSAFLENYAVGLESKAAEAYSAFTWDWNRGEVTPQGWNTLRKHQARLEAHARRRPEKLLQHGDLTTNLVKFFKNQLQ
jgi:uncharacterized repeat protein (TIGR03837 family)